MIYRRWYLTPERNLQSEIITKDELQKFPLHRRIKVGRRKVEELMLRAGDVTIEGDRNDRD